MDRSLGFGSTTCNYSALFRLAFAPAPQLNCLTSLHIVTRRSVLQKVRDQTFSRPLSACKRTVSGSLSLPSRGTFHLSLTVLYSIGHMVVFSLRRWSSVLPSGFLVSRRTLDSRLLIRVFAYGAFTLFRLPFQVYSANTISRYASPNPIRISTNRLGSSDFARHYFRNRFSFFSSG